MVLLIDNSGTSVNILGSMVRSLGYSVITAANTTSSENFNAADYEAVILSPGMAVYDDSGLSSWMMRSETEIPLLALCQSMFRLVSLRGGDVTASGPVFREDTVSHTGESLFRGIPQRFRITERRFHSVNRGTVPDIFEKEAFSSDGSIQGISLSGSRVYGLAFDPCLYRAECGIIIISNFLDPGKV